jgi:hypothetical protein
MLGIALDSTDPGNPEQLAWLEETLTNTDGQVEAGRASPSPILERVPRVERRGP